MIKIAYLVSRYPAVSHTFIQREIQALRSRGFTIFVASINEPDIQIEQTTALDSTELKQTFYVKKKGILGSLKAFVKSFVERPLTFLKGLCFSFHFRNKGVLYPLFYFTEAVLVGEWMKKNQINHLHVHFANPASTVALILTKIYPFTFSMTIHGPDEFYDVTLNALKEKIAGAKFIFCISYYTRSQLMRLTPPEIWYKLEIAPLGVDPATYQPRVFNENPSPIDIISVGRLNSNKGHQILIEAISILSKESLPIHLRIVGEGPERSNLEKLIQKLNLQEIVTLKGALNQEQTLKAYRQADIFALASFAEGLPVSLMEAMSMEIPCIATTINAIPELIQNGVNGWLIAPSNADELSEALKSLIQNPSLRKKLGQNGRKTILEKYDLTKNIDKLAIVFKKYCH